MHLLDGTAETKENIAAMSSSAGDIKLRRKNLVSVRPPRLRLGPRALVAQSQKPSVQLQNKELSVDVSYTTAQNNVGPVGNQPQLHGVSSSSSAYNGAAESFTNDSNDNERYQTQAENKKDFVSGNNGRPLIHHQRHNLKARFQILKTLGQGTYGKVKLAADRATGEHVAIKYIKKTKIVEEGDLMRIRREIQILSSLRHRHIVNIREVFEKKDKIVLVMDYAQGGELYDYLNKLGRLNEWEARRIFRQIVSAMHYCHQNGIVHRDLKLENIILDDEGNVKIADFGLANYYSHNETLKTFCGSPLYASPEIVNGKPYHGPEVDVWSLGVILYTLVYGAMPFEANSLVSLKEQISQGDYNQPDKPSDAAGLIRHMLTVTASRRATMEHALRHWWVNFSHNLMPNDQPYSPDDEPPSLPYTLHTDSLLDQNPAVIHNRNQSSISSDSDVELDFRPSRWTPRQQRKLDSTGSSLSSSVAGSPAPLDSGISLACPKEDTASIASGLLKLPPEILEILKGCSSKSLAALLNGDKISTGFDLDNNRHDLCPARVPQMCPDDNNLVPSKEDKLVSPSVFDSERKPKRGILKRKGKFSGGDSGCIMHEEMSALSTQRNNDTHIPKSGHLPRRLPSFRDEAHGIFASRHRATQLLETADSAVCNTICANAVSEHSWCSPRLPKKSSSQTPAVTTADNQSMQFQQDSEHSQQPQQQIHHQVPYSICLTFDTQTDPITTNNIHHSHSQSDPIGCSTSSMGPTASVHKGALPATSSELDLAFPCKDKEQTKVIRRPKGILKSSKLSQMEEARNRLSISSIGSNSSADILDLSYDSGDCDHYVNIASSEPDPLTSTSLPNYPLTSHGSPHCLKEPVILSSEFQNLQIRSGEELTAEGREILDDKSSMLYRLTHDTQNLL